MKICGDYPAYKVDARGARSDEAAMPDEFEEVIPIVWRVLRKYPEAQKEVEQEILAGVRKRQAVEEAKRKW